MRECLDAIRARKDFLLCGALHNKNYAERADMRSWLGVSRKFSRFCAPDTAPLDTERSA